MKTVTTFALLVLVASMALGGMTSNVSAAEDPAILLKIATRAQEQIQNQISNDSSDKALPWRPSPGSRDPWTGVPRTSPRTPSLA